MIPSFFFGEPSKVKAYTNLFNEYKIVKKQNLPN